MGVEIRLNNIIESFKGYIPLKYSILQTELSKLQTNPEPIYIYNNTNDYPIELNYKTIYGVKKIMEGSYNEIKDDYKYTLKLKNNKQLEIWSKNIQNFKVVKTC